MNSWKLNSMSNWLVRKAVSKFFNIHFTDVYKTVKSLEKDGIIVTKDGKKYELTLKEADNEIYN